MKTWFKNNMNKSPLLLAISMLLFCLLGVQAQSSLTNSRPNIIVVLTDDQGYAPVGRHGHPWLQTPNLDALFDKSTRFTRFFVSPTCAPSRAGLMGGRHPMKSGVTHTILRRERLALNTVTLPEVLRESGYSTGIFGKWHLGDEEPYQPQNRGFTEVFIHGAGGIGQRLGDVLPNSYFDPIMRHNGTFVKTNGFCTDVIFSAAMGWIRKQKQNDSPFFAYISTNAPHGPYIAPKKNRDRFENMGFAEKHAGFYGMIENIDENVGRLTSKVEDWGLLKNTIIIFMSDNGPAGGGAGKGQLGIDADGTKLEAYWANTKGGKNLVDEGGVRVPFFIRWDGRIKAGQDIDTISAHFDFMPTLAAIAGAKLPQNQIEGLSLVPLIEDPTINWPDRYLITHTGRWKDGVAPDQSKMNKFSVRNQRFRLVGDNKLYDMEADPAQLSNVIGAYPEVAKQMLHAFEKFWSSARPMMINEGLGGTDARPYQDQYELQRAKDGIPHWKTPDLD